jgi:hypothetical protein
MGSQRTPPDRNQAAISQRTPSDRNQAAISQGTPSDRNQAAIQSVHVLRTTTCNHHSVVLVRDGADQERAQLARPPLADREVEVVDEEHARAQPQRRLQEAHPRFVTGKFGRHVLEERQGSTVEVTL